MTRFHR